ncbi:hypothetical protein HDK77DRAFT_116574 [Phyllosticta capitalensis]
MPFSVESLFLTLLCSSWKPSVMPSPKTTMQRPSWVFPAASRIFAVSRWSFTARPRQGLGFQALPANVFLLPRLETEGRSLLMAFNLFRALAIRLAAAPRLRLLTLEGRPKAIVRLAKSVSRSARRSR